MFITTFTTCLARERLNVYSIRRIVRPSPKINPSLATKVYSFSTILYFYSILFTKNQPFSSLSLLLLRDIFRDTSYYTTFIPLLSYLARTKISSLFILALGLSISTKSFKSTIIIGARLVITYLLVRKSLKRSSYTNTLKDKKRFIRYNKVALSSFLEDTKRVLFLIEARAFFIAKAFLIARVFLFYIISINYYKKEGRFKYYTTKDIFFLAFIRFIYSYLLGFSTIRANIKAKVSKSFTPTKTKYKELPSSKEEKLVRELLTYFFSYTLEINPLALLYKIYLYKELI
ncbi:hypothetical protein LZ32DRAFT_618818 [Colletotrichum eremochloae]|nr:hypothetical protein LZ32DRAFT_618818 [Colletotrichum eremochloae]